MNTSTKVPVVILNGFLGSGKTTLFRNLLAQSRKQNISVCAIVNDMSELDVDGELLGTSELIEENKSILRSIHSCVLSSKKGIQKLDEALHELLANQSPKLIIVETSGSCHPMPLVKYFSEQQKVKLTGVLALVDSLMLAHDYHFGKNLIPLMQSNLVNGKRDTTNLLVEQIMFCSHLILTKTDRIKEHNIPQITTHIQTINPYVSASPILFGKLDIRSLFDLPEYDYFKVEQLINELNPVLEAEEQEDKPYNLATRVIKDDRPFHPERLWNACHQHLDQRIYRSKGFFWLASRDKYSLLWNQAAGGINLEIIGFWRSGIIEDKNHGISDFEITELKKMLAKETGRFGDRKCDLTVIGDHTQVDRFTNALKACFLTDEEVKLWEEGHVFPDPWPKNILKMT